MPHLTLVFPTASFAAAELRLDIPFVPYMTVGADLDLTNAKTIADNLNSSNFEIQFDLNELFVVEISKQNADRRLGASIPLRRLHL